ncbi:MAG: hypothetical protein ABIG63_11050, partial [Chloroflexota bacterium]
MKRLVPIIILFMAVILPFSAFAQEDGAGITLRLTRDWGYGGFNGQIEGTFSMRVTGPENLERVEYFMDEELIAEIAAEPFNFQFHTGNFDPGIHTMYATGYTSDGSTLRSNEVARDFLSADQASNSTNDMIVPLLIVVGGATLLGVLAPLLMGRKKKHRPGEYGMAGGAVCPRCTFPYSRNVLSPNLFIGKLERCPHCGKWAVVPRATPAELEA